MQVIMSWEAFRKMRAYVNSSYPEKDAKNEKISLKEITGWGTVDQLPNGNLYIEEVFLMPQEATAAHVEMDMDGWSNMITELAMGEHADKLGKLNMWWHSHPFAKGPGEKNPQFSSIDTGTMEKFEVRDGFLLSIVTDQYGQMTARYDQWTPVRQRVELEVTVEYPPLYQEDLDEVRPEVVEKVTFPEPKVVSYGKGNWGNGRYGGQNSGRDSLFSGDRKKSKSAGRWVVWRLPTTGEPYENERFHKKKAAEDQAEVLTAQMSTATFPAKYCVMELPSRPDSDGNPIIAKENESLTMYVVRRIGSSYYLSTHCSIEAAQAGLVGFIDRMSSPENGSEYEIAEVQFEECKGCGFWAEDVSGVCDDCKFDREWSSSREEFEKLDRWEAYDL